MMNHFAIILLVIELNQIGQMFKTLLILNCYCVVKRMTTICNSQEKCNRCLSNVICVVKHSFAANLLRTIRSEKAPKPVT
jgi:hypothetical protein